MQKLPFQVINAQDRYMAGQGVKNCSQFGNNLRASWGADLAAPGQARTLAMQKLLGDNMSGFSGGPGHPSKAANFTFALGWK